MVFTQPPHAIRLFYIIAGPAQLWRAGTRAFKFEAGLGAEKFLTEAWVDCCTHGAPSSPLSALLAEPFLGEPLGLDLGWLPGGMASGDVVQNRSAAPPDCVYRQPLCS